MIAGQVSLRSAGVGDIPIYNVENACASASSAFNLAWQSVAGGIVDIALVVGTEKLSHPDKGVIYESIGRSLDVESADHSSGHGRSPFMDIYATEACAYMESVGATIEDFADSCDWQQSG